MTFDEILDKAVAILQRRGRIAYRALKRQFDLDDAAFDDLKESILYGYPQAFDDGRGITWTGDVSRSQVDAPHTASEIRFQALLPLVTRLLQSERRITYRTLKYVFGADASLLRDIQQELAFRQLACDEGGEGLVWIATEADATVTPAVSSPAAEDENCSDELAIPSQTLHINVPPDDEPATMPEPARSVPEAERRQLTVMFCDLADSTQLSQRLDPEDLREVIRAYQATAAEVVQQFEGYIAQYLGDGLLIYLGWPQAHEDDAQRALHAGLGIVEAITNTLNPQLEHDKGVQLAVRLGIHTGPVVVGEMGGGGRHENLATGETVNIASRLEGLAASNTVVISPTTEQLVRDAFVLDNLGPHLLKGVAEAMPLWRVLGVRDLDHDVEERANGGFENLVGRDEEIGLLLRRWVQSKEGLGQVVLINGEAGIGKSSLVEGLRAHVQQEDATRITFRCSQYTQHSALYPVIVHLQRVLGWQRDDTAGDKLVKLEQTLQQTTLTLDEAVPLLAMLLSLPLPDGRYLPLALSPQEQRQRTQDVLVAWMLEEAERQPVLVVWEDLHWADPSTQELLGLFIDQVPTVPMLHVMAFRPTFVAPWPTHSHMTLLTLNHLERPQVEALITRLTGGKPLPLEVVEHIVGKTDGVPLYVEELTKMLLDSDLLDKGAEQYTLTGPLAVATIPATLHDSLMARLDRLPTVREVAQLGAVLGREFDYETLHALAVVEEAVLQEGLSKLVGTDLLYQRGRPPRATYTFRHALIRDTAYQSLLRRTRQQYHQQVAQLLEANFPEVVERQPELVAHHYAEAACSELAVTFYLRAGDRSAGIYANAEAITYYEQALVILDALPASEETDQQRIELSLRIASLHVLLGHYGESLPFFNQALALAEAVGDTKTIAHLETRLGRVRYSMGHYEEARMSLERALQLSQKINDTTRMAICYQSLGYVYFSRDRLASVIDCFSRALQISEATDNQEGIGVACTYLSNAHARAGNPQEAVQWGQRALELGEHMQDERRIAWACIMLAQACVLTGDVAWAQTLLDRALALCDKTGDFLALAWVHIWQGDLLATHEKDYKGALQHVQHVIRMGTESGGFPHEVSHQYARGAEYHLRLGHVNEAFDYCQHGLAISQPASNKLEFGYAYMVLAEVHSTEAYQDWHKADGYLEESLQAFHQVGAQVDIGRACLAGARIATQRQDGKARQWTEKARDIFAERGANILLQAAEEQLEMLR